MRKMMGGNPTEQQHALDHSDVLPRIGMGAEATPRQCAANSQSNKPRQPAPRSSK
jgi:hypothetical protein